MNKLQLISRAQLAKELEPGLNALFGLEYDEYNNEFSEIFSVEDSERAFEDEVMIVGFGAAPVKTEGGGVNFDSASEGYTARYTHETVSLAFALTQEAIEDLKQAKIDRDNANKDAYVDLESI